MSQDPKSIGKSLQHMIKKRNHLPVKKKEMMMMIMKVPLLRSNHSDKRSTKREATEKVKQ